MSPFLGKAFIIVGGVLIVLGVVMLFGDRIPFLGRLPGDVVYKKDNVTVYFPIVTMLIISVLLTIILNIFRR